MNIAAPEHHRPGFVQFIAARTRQEPSAVEEALAVDSRELDTVADDPVEKKIEYAAELLCRANLAERKGDENPTQEFDKFGEVNPLVGSALEEVLDEVADWAQSEPRLYRFEAEGNGIFAVDFADTLEPDREQNYTGTLFVDTTPGIDGVVLYYGQRAEE